MHTVQYKSLKMLAATTRGARVSVLASTRRARAAAGRPQQGRRKMSTYDKSKSLFEQDWTKEPPGRGRIIGLAKALVPWSKQNPGKAMAVAAFSVLELTPYGPTGNLLWLPWKISESRKAKARLEEEMYDIVEVKVPEGKCGGDLTNIVNPHVPEVVYHITVPEGKGPGDTFKVKLPRKN
jgi:hypothetical protein